MSAPSQLSQSVSAARQSLAVLTAPLLEDGSSYGAQLQATHQLHAHWNQLGAVSAYAPATRQEDTGLPGGAALGPTRAAQCLMDFMRTRRFLRAVGSALHKALEDAARRHARGPLHVLYAGCGPYATLALPWMARFAPDQVQWTLVDVHAASLRSVGVLLEAYALQDRVRALLQEDAACLVWPKDTPLDGLVCEAMQVGLTRECQVAVVTHLAPQLAPWAFMVPEAVHVDAALVHQDLHTTVTMGGAAPPEWHQPLGRVATLDRATALQGPAAVYHGLTGVLPASVTPSDHQVELRTTVVADADNVLGVRECALTLPLPMGAPGHWRPSAPFVLRHTWQGAPTVALRQDSVGP